MDVNNKEHIITLLDNIHKKSVEEVEINKNLCSSIAISALLFIVVCILSYKTHIILLVISILMFIMYISCLLYLKNIEYETSKNDMLLNNIIKLQNDTSDNI